MSDNTATFQIRDYVVFKKRIGKGGFSNIYKAFDKKNQRMVAIKEICLDTLSKYKESIKRETKIMKNLNHPNIVRLYDTIIDDTTDNIYLVLEYLGRGDFSKFLKKRPLKEKYAKKYLKQLSSGLKYLLENKIIHRDLKPQNILVTNLGDIKIADFGFARYFDNDMVIQTICGSPLYMAPEIMKNKKYDLKSDLWSVGIILYEMLVGHAPFRAKNIFDLMKQIEKNDVKIPMETNISDDCRDLLLKLLQKEPEKRISWPQFFTHPWLDTEFKEREDMLMEISNMNNLDDMNQMMLENTGSLFENGNSIINSIVHNSKNNMVTSNRQSSFHNIKNDMELDLSLKFNFELEQSGDTNQTESDDEVFYDSFENKEDMDANHISESVDGSFVNLKIEDNYFDNSFQIKKDLRRNKHLRDFEYISSSIPIDMDRSTNMESSSILNYLSNSVYFFKQSYKYISNFNSI
jgi:serine/threonine protein kinase